MTQEISNLTKTVQMPEGQGMRRILYVKRTFSEMSTMECTPSNMDSGIAAGVHAAQDPHQ